ncbi:mCG144743, partial [Mus musculus]
ADVVPSEGEDLLPGAFLHLRHFISTSDILQIKEMGFELYLVTLHLLSKTKALSSFHRTGNKRFQMKKVTHHDCI